MTFVTVQILRWFYKFLINVSLKACKLTLLSLFFLKLLRKVTFVTDLRLLRGAYTFVTAKFSLKCRGDFASLSHSDIPQNIELSFIHLSQFYPKILKWFYSLYICSKTCVNFIILLLLLLPLPNHQGAKFNLGEFSNLMYLS